jgi:hypothetical protein
MKMRIVWRILAGVVLFTCLRVGAQSEPLEIWDSLHPVPTTADLTGVMYANGQYLAGGGVGTFLSSTDAVNWIVHDLTASNAVNYQVNSFVFGGGEYVAVGGGSQGTILTSTDGIRWTPEWSGVYQGLNSVTYGIDRFVAVGSASGRAILTSKDGRRWTVRRLSEEGSLRQVVFGRNQFVAVGDSGAILVSGDGVRWSSFTVLGKNQLSGIAYGIGHFVVVGERVLLSSTDGTSWTTNALSLQGTPSVTFGDGKFVIMGQDDKVGVSTDGVTWKTQSTAVWTRFPFGTNITMEPVTVSVLHNVWAITYGGGQFVAVGDRGLVATSPDGLKWVGHFGRDQPDPKRPRRTPGLTAQPSEILQSATPASDRKR